MNKQFCPFFCNGRKMLSHFESTFEGSLMVQYIVWKLEILLGEYLTLFCNCTLDLRSLLLFIPGCHWLGFVLLLFYCSEWAIIIASGLKRNQLNNNWWNNALCLVKFLRRLHKTESSFGLQEQNITEKNKTKNCLVVILVLSAKEEYLINILTLNSHEWPRKNFSLQYQNNINQTRDENKKNFS